jgi:TonB family protein
MYRENAFRCCVNPPRQVYREKPDLSGLPPITGEQIAIIEVRISAAGHVTESCMLRGVREDADRKALEAAKTWQFEPPRLLVDADLMGGVRLPAGTAVPIFMTVTMRLGPS